MNRTETVSPFSRASTFFQCVAPASEHNSASHAGNPAGNGAQMVASVDCIFLGCCCWVAGHLHLRS